MNMSGDIRVRTRDRYKKLYNELKNFAVGDMHELFVLCACVGHKRERKIPLGKDADARFWSSTFTPDEYSAFYAMILEKPLVETGQLDLSLIQDDGAVIREMEEYANGGMEVLIEDFLSDYLAQASTAQPQLDMSCAQELPRAILNYIYEEI